MIQNEKEPIVAVATAAGRGGIGIVRLSFDARYNEAMKNALFGETVKLIPRHAHLLPFYDGKGELLDHAIVLFFKAPHSYTGESVIEIQAHGGTVLVQMILRACLEKCASLGLRMADPGEFTQRAFMNGRMDLAQAEAVADLIDAMSESAAQAATRSLSGEFSTLVRDIGNQVNELRAFIEATLDFPEEEVEFLQAGHILSRLERVDLSLNKVLDNAQQGSVLREGITVAIVGSPNVGKSSLLNALAEEDVAIVTDIPGTTRDKIEWWVTLNGVPLRIVDTAGIRETSDVVESKGIERALAEIRKADVVLHLTDASGAIRDDKEALSRVLHEVRPGVPLLEVKNKADLCLEKQSEQKSLIISAKEGYGLEALKNELFNVVGMTSTPDGLFMARERHVRCLREAQDHISQALLILHSELMLDLIAEELRLAGRALGEILGETVADDILGMIFSKFCIGK